MVLVSRTLLVWAGSGFDGVTDIFYEHGTGELLQESQIHHALRVR